ncbi:MAG: HD domain-containing phosphohydrolase [Bdellovibrionota bacterium]
MNFVQVSTATLRPHITLGFDVYLLISGKHLLYVNRNDNIEPERLERLKAKNVRTLYVESKDFEAYERFLKKSATLALNDASMPNQVKAAIITGQSKAAVESMFTDPEKKENYLATQAAAANQVALLQKQPEAIADMLKVASFDKTTYQHSVNVATIAIGIATALEAPEKVREVIGTGALLHDLGRTAVSGQSDPNAPPKPVDQMTPEEHEHYLQHPRAGAGRLLDKKHISRDVLDIILLHEERLDGRGFPSGVKKLDQIFQVVGLANLYDRYVTFEGKTPKEAYLAISEMKPLPYEEDLVAALKDVLEGQKIY